MRWFFLGLSLVSSSLACARAPTASAPAVSHANAPLLGVFEPAAAEPARKATLVALAPRLDEFFASKMAELRATGAAVGIVLEGELVYARGFGVQNVDSKTPVDTDSVFHIASLTKSFTALAVMKLRDEGKLALDEPVQSYLPELASLKLPTRDAAPVTARLLLSMASGLQYDDMWGAVSHGLDDAEFSRLLAAGPSFATVPGARYGYSNLGYALLGKLVERVSGLRFTDYVSANILRPLGMSSGVWSEREVPPARLARGYRWKGEQLLPEETALETSFEAAGGLYTSLRDYARYVSFNLAAYPPRDDPETGPVRRSTLREMHEGQRWTRQNYRDAPIARRNDTGVSLLTGSYGFGWHAVTTCSEEQRVQHGGFEPGYFSAVILLPKQRIGLVVLATTEPVGFRAAGGVFALLREAGLLATPAPAPSPELTRSANAMRSLLERWDAALVAQTFDPKSLRYSWFEGVQAQFARLAEEHGRCEADGALRTTSPLQGAFDLKCERGSIEFDLLLTPGRPPLVQALEVRQSFPADERATQAATALATWNDGGSGPWLAATFDREKSRKALARLALEHGTCAVAQGTRQVEHTGFGTSSEMRFPLSCASGPLDLTLNFDESSGKIVWFSARPPAPPNATCWQ
jgi:CubicO group peptidase (beta-lactamase class C family)